MSAKEAPNVENAIWCRWSVRDLHKRRPRADLMGLRGALRGNLFQRLGSGYKTKFTITSYWWSFYCDLLSWEETRFTWESGRELKGQKSLEKIAASRYICTYYISALVTVSFEAEIPLISSFHWSLCENPISGTGVSAKSLPSRNLLHDRKHDAVSAVLGWRQRAILNFTPLG
jgi:hypothetical protein